MEAPLAPSADHARAVPSPTSVYYDEADVDFGLWSRARHLHFGYWDARTALVDREAMLERMSDEVIEGLALAPRQAPRVLDLGCGLGATARCLAERHRDAAVHGLTISEVQVREASRRAHEAGLHARVTFERADYLQIPARDASVDGAYAIESACYAPGLAKAQLVSEVARVLKPRARFVIADAFLRRDEVPRGLAGALHEGLCRRWRLPCLGAIGATTAALERAGFEAITVRDISLRVAPSVLHVPLVTARAWLADPALRADPVRRDNALAPLYALGLGLLPGVVGYFLIHATRR